MLFTYRLEAEYNKNMGFLVIIIFGIIFYFSSLNYYFSQDDFIHLYSSNASNLLEFLNFFNPFAKFPDIFFFRPLGTQVYFFLNKSLFGLNPLIFHLESLLLHIVNGLLFFVIVKKIWKSQQIAILASFLYTISAAHFLSLFYISAFQQILRTSFSFLSILFFIKYQESLKVKNLIFSLTAFVAALLSKETSIMIPFLFLPLEVLRTSELVVTLAKKIFKVSMPFLAILGIYFLIRIPGFQSIFNEGEYAATTSLFSILQNLKWYLIWTFGLPEILATYPSLKFASLWQFANDFKYADSILIAFGIFAVSLIIIIFRNATTLKNYSKILAIAALFLFPLLPVLVLSQHRYPQYLDLSHLGLFPFVASLCVPFFSGKKFTKLVLIISFTCLQFLSIKLTEATHWATHRADVAQYYAEVFSKNYTNQEGVVFTGDYNQLNQVSVALGKNYGIYVWSNNSLKNVEYRNITTKMEDFNKLLIPITKF